MSQKKGFGNTKTQEKYQTFRVDYKAYNPDTEEESDVETVLYKIPLSKGNAIQRRHQVAAAIALYFETETAKQRGINLAFVWNSEAANFEPICQLSSIPLPGTITLDFTGLNTQKGFTKLTKIVEGFN